MQCRLRRITRQVETPDTTVEALEREHVAGAHTWQLNRPWQRFPPQATRASARLPSASPLPQPRSACRHIRHSLVDVVIRPRRPERTSGTKRGGREFERAASPVLKSRSVSRRWVARARTVRCRRSEPFEQLADLILRARDVFEFVVPIVVLFLAAEVYALVVPNGRAGTKRVPTCSR